VRTPSEREKFNLDPEAMRDVYDETGGSSPS
jgi:hypothetical protein